MTGLQTNRTVRSGESKWTFTIRSLLVLTSAISVLLACWRILGGSGLVIGAVLVGALFWTIRRRSAVALVLLCLMGKWSYGKLQQGVALNHFERIGVNLAIEDDLPLLFSDIERLEKWPHARITDRDLLWLQCVPTIEAVWLDGTAVTDAGVFHIRDLPRLRWLDLAGTKVTDAALEQVGRLTTLEQLVLNDTAIGDSGLTHLGELTNLQMLILDDTQVTNAGIAHLARLSNLDSLFLNGTQISDAGLLHLVRLSRLRCLYVGGTDVTDAGCKRLQQTLPNCEIMR